MDQYRCMYSQHCTSRNVIPSNTIHVRCHAAATGSTIACACTSALEHTPEKSNRSVFISVSVFCILHTPAVHTPVELYTASILVSPMMGAAILYAYRHEVTQSQV